MKRKIIFAVLLVAVFFTGCKNEKSVDSLEVVQSEVVDNNFKVTLSVIAKKDDDFALFYTEDGTTNFIDTPIWQGVKGNDNTQEIKYILPNEVFPTQLRMDFGLKQDQEDIILKSVTLEYKSNKKVIAGPELITFFRADENKCTFDASTGVIKALEKDGMKQSPSLYPQEVVLGPELRKLAE
jgi:hypothetical protein